MNKIFLKKFLCLVCLTVVLIQACKDPWENRETDLELQALNQTVLEEISTNPNLSKFHELLKKSGTDKRLQESRTFTVWAPTNEALEGLSSSIINDEQQLTTFLENHIVYQPHFTKEAGTDGVYLTSLNGKKVFFQKARFEENSILDADKYYKNGVLHIINGVASPKPSAYEYLVSLDNKQAKFIQGLEYVGKDVSKGVILYYDPVTREPVYQEGTTFDINKNRYFENISNIASEDSLLTYIILSDSAFDYEFEQLKEFNQDSILTKADSLTKWHVIKDLVINGVKEGAALNDSLLSVTGVKIKINPEDIVATKRLSNGIAYVVNKVNYELLTNKIPTIIIEGTMVDSLRVPSSTSVKILKDFAGNVFRQLETPNITSSPNPLYYFRYKVQGYSTQYSIHIRARNTFFTVPLSMAIAAGRKTTNIASLDKSPYFQIPVYDENTPETLSEIDIPGYVQIHQKGDDLYIYLVSAEGATSAAPTALAVNYIKLVPIN